MGVFAVYPDVYQFFVLWHIGYICSIYWTATPQEKFAPIFQHLTMSISVGRILYFVLGLAKFSNEIVTIAAVLPYVPMFAAVTLRLWTWFEIVYQSKYDNAVKVVQFPAAWQLLNVGLSGTLATIFALLAFSPNSVQNSIACIGTYKVSLFYIISALLCVHLASGLKKLRVVYKGHLHTWPHVQYWANVTAGCFLISATINAMSYSFPSFFFSGFRLLQSFYLTSELVIMFFLVRLLTPQLDLALEPVIFHTGGRAHSGAPNDINDMDRYQVAPVNMSHADMLRDTMSLEYLSRMAANNTNLLGRDSLRSLVRTPVAA